MKIKEVMYEVNFNNQTLNVRVQYKKVKYLRIKVLANKDIIIVSRYKLNLNDVNKILLSNEKSLVKYLNKKRQVINENEVFIFGNKYLKDSINYKDEYLKAIEYIKIMFEEIRIKYNFPKVELYFSKMKSRWGVCYPSKKRIGLSVYLTCVPFHLIEYVILHEFSHLKVSNHSVKFYNELAKYYPKYKEAKRELKEFSSVLM